MSHKRQAKWPPKRTIKVRINGKAYESEIETRLLLVYYLRDVLGLKGTNIGCDTSNCGACTIIMNGDSVKSCTILGVQADGQEIMTIEGLSEDGKLHPIQVAFSQEHALQCGYCTPGMIMSTYALLNRNADPTDQEIRLGIAGNLCRCTGYYNIVKAVQLAAKKGVK